MIGKLFRFIAIVASLVALAWLPAYAQGSDNTQSTSWGHIKSVYRTDGDKKATTLGSTEQTIKLLQTAKTEEEAQKILAAAPASVREQLMSESAAMISRKPVPPAWTHPVAGEAMRKFGLASSDILAVQRVVALENGVPIDSADVVVTDKQWYYSSLTDGRLTSTPPSRFAMTREIDIYGITVESVSGWMCANLEWVVTFYLPVCFHEISPGRFDGIVDAWAPNPPCNQCNGGWCIGNLCGSAWDGPGYNSWWDYNTCGQSWSRKVGKLVQKRWLYTWRNCGHADWEIASWVRTRIRY
jgi:hypothetical protein